METVDISQSMATQSWRSSELGNRAEAAQSGATDTQGTEYTEYSTDGSYTDSDSEGESGSEGGDGSVSHRAEAVQSRIPRPTVRPTR